MTNEIPKDSEDEKPSFINKAVITPLKKMSPDSPVEDNLDRKTISSERGAIKYVLKEIQFNLGSSKPSSKRIVSAIGPRNKIVVRARPSTAAAIKPSDLSPT